MLGYSSADHGANGTVEVTHLSVNGKSFTAAQGLFYLRQIGSIKALFQFVLLGNTVMVVLRLILYLIEDWLAIQGTGLSKVRINLRDITLLEVLTVTNEILKLSHA